MAGLASDTNEETLQDISAQLTHIFYPGFIKSLNDEMGFWSMLPKRKGEGKLIEVKFHYGRNTAAKSNTETGTAGDAVAPVARRAAPGSAFLRAGRERPADDSRWMQPPAG